VSAASGRLSNPKSAVAAAVAANAMEFYDFVAYSFFAVYIGKAFFPTYEPSEGLLLSLAVFGVGFVTRPLGGIVIGAIADQVGRKAAMLLTLVLVTLGTLGIAVTPTFDRIGIAAPVIVVICRLVQGLAVGGEIGTSGAFLLEAAPQNQRGFYVSWQPAGQGAAALAAGLVGVALTFWLSSEELQTWGWRVPFALSVLLLPIGFQLRRHLVETLHQVPMTPADRGMRGLTRQKGNIVLGILIVTGFTVSSYVGNFATTYAITTLKLAPSVAMSATVMVGAAMLSFAMLGGWLCDRYGPIAVMLWPRIAIVLLVVPAFTVLIHHPRSGVLLGVAGLLAALNILGAGGYMIALLELFPRGARATALSIAYGIGVAVFGGTTQFVVEWLIDKTHNPAAPAWYAAAASLIAVAGIVSLPRGGK
jgi:MFS family permease